MPGFLFAFLAKTPATLQHRRTSRYDPGPVLSHCVTHDELKRRIEEASKYVDLDQLALSPQCRFSSNAIGNLVTVYDERANFNLIREVAEDVWG